MKKQILSALILASAAGVSASATEALWMRDVQISPDGTQIAFTYKGDIWTVPVSGGEAKRITTLPSYEAAPVWSPDSKQIAFASDRNGSLDVYVVPATGGTATRLTSNSADETPQAFTPDGKNVVFSATIQDPASSVQFPSARMSELYQVPVAGGASVQINAATIVNPFYSPDGTYMVYEDYKGMEDIWRKHHTSSVAHDVWKYDFKSGKYTNLTSHAGEDRNPVISVDGKTIYFLSERDGGTMNVYAMPAGGSDKVTPVTAFKTHPVRFLSRANSGLMAMGYNGEIYTMMPDGKPSKVKVTVTVDEAPQIETIGLQPTSVAVSNDGKQIAFISRGDVFVTSADYSSTKQITDTPEAERWLTWSPDGKKLVYTSERDGHWNLYQAELANDTDPNFSNATTISEKALFSPKDKKERTYAAFSPDGKTLAFIQDRDKIMLMDVKSGKVRQLTDGSTVMRRSGGVGFDWSPDSKWLLTTIVDRKHDPYSDIAIINVQTGEIHNLTGTGYSDDSPRWADNGNVILFASERYGMRAHASWGSQEDVMAIFLNREAFERFKLSEEDYELYKEQEKKAKKEAEAKDKADAKDKKVSKKEEKKDIVVELDGINRRTVRLTPFSSRLRSFVATADSKSLYFVTGLDNSYDLWKIDLRKGDAKLVQKKLAGALDIDKDGKIYVIGMNMKRVDPKSDKVTPISISGTHRINHDAERAYMFDYVRRQEREMFYDKNMHGVDWKMMTDNYERFLPHINNNYDFAELLSELLGELNVSHTGGRYRHPASVNNDRTASLGLLYDMTYTGNGWKVEEVVAGSPFDVSSSKVRKGTVVTHINGTEITPKTDLGDLLNNIAKKKTLVSLKNPETGETWNETVRPISASQMSSLMYDRWIAARAADVDRWSNGRLGYVHIKAMNDDAFRPVYADLLGKYNDREGVVVDIRYNGGGRMHEDIEVLLSGKKYLTQVVRGKETCDMPSRRWNKPSVMVTCEACYSNAHGTPWVYQTMGLGKIVGAPVPGTMTSVNWVTMQDPTMVFGIPVVGYRTAEGNYLENTQLVPDITVLVNPEDQNSGNDLQLKAAVESLLKDIDAAKNK